MREKESDECVLALRAHNFNLCAVGELLDGVTVLRVVLQQDCHLEGGGLQRVPKRNNIQQHCSNHCNGMCVCARMFPLCVSGMLGFDLR